MDKTTGEDISMQADPLRWKALTVVCAAFFMTILDVSIVNVALPSIGKSLHFSRDDLQWVITAYAITYGGFLLLAGRLADLFGRRRVFLIGVVIFTVASLLCGLAWSEGVLIAARAVQGVGAAVITPSALSIVMTTVEEGGERNQALGIWGARGGRGAAAGVVTAGSAVLWAGLAQSLTTRLGVKPVLAAGFIAMTAGAIWYTQIPASGSFVTALLPGYLLIGFGLPFTFIPVSIAALAGVSHDEAGLASGLINTTQQIGGAVGIAVCASVSLSRFNHLTALHGPSYYAQALTSGTALAFWVLVAISVAALVAGLMLIKREELAPEAGEALAR